MGVEDLIDLGGIVSDKYRSKLREIGKRVVQIDRSDWTLIHSHPNEITAKVQCSQLEHINDGLARTVFELPTAWTIKSSHCYVVKFPFSQTDQDSRYNGYKQNRTEVRESKNIFLKNKYPDNLKDVFCPVVDFDQQSRYPKWVLMPLGSKIENADELKPEKMLKDILHDCGYYDDINRSGVMLFDDGDCRAIDIGMGIHEIGGN